ncbi:MAG TPA: hypothetical protein VHZ51_00355 [Ktedonobacteraceae bacterium]|nr:hypothetical protein [Ktedonobacteraceae bacterium]
MNIQRAITILIAHDEDLQQTLKGFQHVQQALSPSCYNGGKPLNA